MTPAPIPACARTAALAARVLAWVAAGVVWLGAALTAAPAPAEAQQASFEIRNIAEIRFRLGANEPEQRIFAENRLEVTAPLVQGELSLMQFDCEIDCPTRRSLSFAAGDFATGASAGGSFAPLPQPVNLSGSFGPQGPVDLNREHVVVPNPVLPPGMPVFVVLDSPDLNRNPDRIETALVTLSDNVTGDVELIRLYETAPDSGVFTAAIGTATPPPVAGDGVLSTVANSQIVARYQDPYNAGHSLNAKVVVGPVDPAGVVFDQTTGRPVNGVRLTLLDAQTGAPALVLGYDLRSAFPATVVTGGSAADESGRVYRFGPGEFRFPHVMPGLYRFHVVPPPGYDLPPRTREVQLAAADADGVVSMQLSSHLAGRPVIDASFGEAFEILPGVPIVVNFPLVPTAEAIATATASRTADVNTAAPGDFVTYTVTMSAPAAVTIDLVDMLPPAVRYVPGSLLVNGVSDIPALSPAGDRLTVAGLSLPAGQTTTVRYTAQVTVSAQPGQRQNSRSELHAGAAVLFSAGHELRIGDGFGMDRIAVLGQVVAGPCGAPEPAGSRDLSGIRIHTETGEWADTDADGRFSLRDLRRRTTVLQLDALSLPRNARPVLCRATTRHAGSAISQFVETAAGMMGRAEFHIVFDGDEDERAAAATAARPSAWHLPEVPRPELTFTQQWLDQRTADAAPQLLFPAEGNAPQSAMVDVFYLRRSGQTGEVMVNGRSVNPDRRMPALNGLINGLALDRWRAVRLEDGRNRITVILREADGTEVFRASRTLWQATEPAFMEVLAETSALESDGRSNPVVELRLTDRNGIPLRPGGTVSVRISEPFAFAAQAPRPGEAASARGPITSTTAQIGANGVIRLELAPVREPGSATLEIATRHHLVATRVRISVADRPWVLVGLAEGTLAPGRIRRTGTPGADIRDPASGRVAFFAEGVVRGEWLLTLRYDSAARRSDGFHGIDPDADYLVYGDASRQGHDAKGRFPLYVRLRQEGAEFLVGDFDAAINTGLVRFNRRMSGARAEIGDDQQRVLAFVALTDDRHVEDRIPADGTAGPFALGAAGMVQHSEVVRVAVVSRHDASEILQTRVLRTGIDYTIDRARGELRLRNPLPAFTPDLDRNLLIVDYAVENPGSSGRIAGVRAERDIDAGLRAGATLIDARRLGGEAVNARLTGVDLRWKPDDFVTFSAEAAQMTKRFGFATHRARQVELRMDYDDGAARISAYARRQKGDMSLSTGTAAVDADVFGLDAAVNLDAAIWGQSDRETGLFLEAGALRERDRAAGSLRLDARAMLVRRGEDATEEGLGLRVLRRDDAAGRSEAVKLTSRASWRSGDGRLSLTLGAEHTVARRGANLPGDHLTLEAGYALGEDLDGFIALAAAPGRGQGSLARIGFIARPWDEGRLTASIVRAEQGGRDGFSAYFGIDQDFRLGETMALSFGLDAQSDLGAAGVPVGVQMGTPFIAESFVTLRAALSRNGPDWGARAEAQARFADAERKLNLRVSGDGMLNDGWSFGASAFAGRIDRTGAPTRHDIELRAGAAHRTGPGDPITLIQTEITDGRDGISDRRKAYAAVHHHRYLSAVDALNTRYAVKFTELRNDTGRHKDILGFVGAEYRRDMSDKFDLGIHGALMHSRGSGGTDASVGFSVGFTPFENGWLSVGYNLRGFRDADFSEQGHTDRGAFVQFRMKFDQTTLREWLR